MTITPEQRHEIEQAGALRIEDPETHAAYVILKAEVYERMKPLLEKATTRFPKASAGLRTHSSATFRNSSKTRACWASASPTAETSGSGSPLPTSRSSGRSTAGESRTMSSTCS